MFCDAIMVSVIISLDLFLRIIRSYGWQGLNQGDGWGGSAVSCLRYWNWLSRGASVSSLYLFQASLRQTRTNPTTASPDFICHTLQPVTAHWDHFLLVQVLVTLASHWLVTLAVTVSCSLIGPHNPAWWQTHLGQDCWLDRDAEALYTQENYDA